MKFYIVFSFFILSSLSCLSQSSIPDWIEFQKQHLKNRQDSATWSKELLQRDIDDSTGNQNGKPFQHGAFPVPKYELAGYFRYKGAGVAGNFKNYYGKKLVYYWFFANKTEATKEILKEKQNEAFFIIVALTNFVDTINRTHSSAFILSRNNPDVICEGYFKTLNNDEVDYMAFLTANRDEYAVVNMRLFNLKFGRIILIAPQKDHSLRSLQLATPLMSSNEVDGYLNGLLEQDKVKSFFLNSGNL
ncbi:MAG: hypothetical protein WKF97_15545 [Chitinophagaceae bacterium]